MKNLKMIVQEIKPIADTLGLRLNRKKEFDEARKIKNNMDSKVSQLLIKAGLN